MSTKKFFVGTAVVVDFGGRAGGGCVGVCSVGGGCVEGGVCAPEGGAAVRISPAGIAITAPKTYQPTQNARIQNDQQPVVLMVDNATTNGPRPLSYKFDVAVDGDFNTLVFTRDGIEPGTGRTSVRLPDALQSGRNY